MWLVVGLGNPGEEYASTRHNAGFMLVGRAAAALGAAPRGRLYKARTALVRRRPEDVMFALPLTYMNLSGSSVGAMVRAKGVGLDRLVVAYDDLDLPLGTVRIREKGSPGMHKGLRSVASELGSHAFPRIRIGIGPLPEARDAAEFVLSPFEKSELPLLERALDDALEALMLILDGGIKTAMAKFNRKAAAGRTQA